MSEMKEIKIEPVCDDSDQIESVNCIVNKIKKEPEVQFVLILPPRQVKIEKFEELSDGKSQSSEKMFQCQQCPKSYDKRQNLYRHEQTHKPKVKCEICCKNVSQKAIGTHSKRHGNIKKFNCDHCNASFVMKYHLVQHMRKHQSVKQFNCQQCKRGFNQSQNYKTHLQSHSNNPRPFQCDLCPKNFPKKQDAQRHLMATHTQISFKCDKCNFTTKWKTVLISHKQTHSSAKPFSCQVCEKKFKTKAHVQRHQSVHKTTKDFECKTCGKMFGRRDHLKQHQQNVHGKIFKIFHF
jgi:KRAB domain-containing zinc finger protein